MLLFTLNLQSAASIGVSSATTDGADVTAAQAGPVVGVSSTTTDGADVTAAQVGPVVGVASTTADGVDVTAAQAGPVVSFSGATTDGADVSAAAVTVSATVPYSWGSDQGVAGTRDYLAENLNRLHEQRKQRDANTADAYNLASLQADDLAVTDLIMALMYSEILYG